MQVLPRTPCMAEAEGSADTGFEALRADSGGCFTGETPEEK